MSEPKKQGRPLTPVRDYKTATEYRLSISSNSGSRRSSLGAAGNNNNNLDEENLVEACILPQVKDLTDSVVTLDSNFTQMNFIHESLVDLNESLSALLYGLMCNSWCVDFPNVSHDIAHELDVMQELDELERHKNNLLKELSEDARETQSQGIPKQRSAFMKPALRPVSSTAPADPSTLHQENHLAEDDDDDDDNTDASFISNPTVTAAPKSVTRNTMMEKTFNKNSNLRRKSILHTIRNSIGTVPETADTRDRRRSLAVSASRIMNHPPQNKLGALGVAPSRASAIRKVAKKPSSSNFLKSRPPFR